MDPYELKFQSKPTCLLDLSHHCMRSGRPQRWGRQPRDGREHGRLRVKEMGASGVMGGTCGWRGERCRRHPGRLPSADRAGRLLRSASAPSRETENI
jgi:hypothetical protein